jgi:hypothetical protein
MDERVQVGEIDPGERAADRESLSLEPARSARDATHGPLAGERRIGLRDAGQDGDVIDDDGGHGTLLWAGATIAR